MKTASVVWGFCAATGCVLVGCSDSKTAVSSAPVTQVDIETIENKSARSGQGDPAGVATPRSSAELALGDEMSSDFDSSLEGGFRIDTLTTGQSDPVGNALAPLSENIDPKLDLGAPDLTSEVGKLNPYE